MNNCFSVTHALRFFVCFFFWGVKKYNEGNECTPESMCKLFFLFCVHPHDLLYKSLIKIHIIHIEGISATSSCVYLTH